MNKYLTRMLGLFRENKLTTHEVVQFAQDIIDHKFYITPKDKQMLVSKLKQIQQLH